MHCHIRVGGHLSLSWKEWFEQLEIIQEATGTTVFQGYLEDQAALYGVLLKIHRLGLALISLETSAFSNQMGEERNNAQQ